MNGVPIWPKRAEASPLTGKKVFAARGGVSARLIRNGGVGAAAGGHMERYAAGNPAFEREELVMTTTEHSSESVNFDAAPPPSRFQLRTPLLDAGSLSTLLAETPNFQLKIRCYAPHEGENALHSHHNQDHSFVVLQGTARFRGPRGETWDLGRNEGIMLYDGTWYCFENSGEEPLVVLRIASFMPEQGDPNQRLGANGRQIDPHTKDNLRPEKIVIREGAFYE
jgi:mannose-6-phosphate isomerase-like protein (cupin superfamily)